MERQNNVTSLLPGSLVRSRAGGKTKEVDRLNKLSKALIIASLSMTLVFPAQAAQHQETGRISAVYYDRQVKEYDAEVNLSGNGFVFSLAIEGPENPLVVEALEKLLVGNIAEVTIDDMGTADIYDDQIISANF